MDVVDLQALDSRRRREIRNCPDQDARLLGAGLDLELGAGDLLEARGQFLRPRLSLPLALSEMMIGSFAAPFPAIRTVSLLVEWLRVVASMCSAACSADATPRSRDRSTPTV